MKLTLHKYIFNEIWPTFLASLFVSVFVIIATRMLWIMELLINKGGETSHVFRMVLYLIPDIIAFALPAATLMGVVIAFLRLAADSEIIALKSCGISLYQMLPTVILISSIGFVIAVSVSVFAIPWGNRSFKDLLFQIAESKADLGIKERVFCEPFNDIVFYVNNFSSREKIMRDVFVIDRRDKEATNTIIAKEGRVYSHPKEKIITIHFSKGTIFMIGSDLRSGRTIQFNTYDLNIGLKDIMAALAARRIKPKEMAIGELWSELKKGPKEGKKYNQMMIELLEKLSIPLGVFLMGIIGVPLGAQLRARGRSTGIGISLFVFLIYYLCLAAARSICETGVVSSKIGVWIPDIFLIISCVYLLWRVANERPINFLPTFLQRPKGVT